jgi:hypothetical protein
MRQEWVFFASLREILKNKKYFQYWHKELSKEVSQSRKEQFVAKTQRRKGLFLAKPQGRKVLFPANEQRNNVLLVHSS